VGKEKGTGGGANHEVGGATLLCGKKPQLTQMLKVAPLMIKQAIPTGTNQRERERRKESKGKKRIWSLGRAVALQILKGRKGTYLSFSKFCSVGASMQDGTVKLQVAREGGDHRHARGVGVGEGGDPSVLLGNH